MANIKKKALFAFFWSGTSVFFSFLLQLIQVYFVGKYLTSQDFGIWGVLTIVLMFIKLFSDSGISSSLIYFDRTNTEELSTIYWLNLFIGIVLYLFLLITVPLLNNFFNVELFNYLAVLGLILIFSPTGLIFQSLLQKSLIFKRLSSIEIFSVFTSAIITILMAINGFGVWALVIGQLSGAVVKSMLFNFFGFKNYNIKFILNLKKVKKFIRFGIFQFGDKIFNYLGFKIDQFIIGPVLGIEALGFYNFAFNLAFKPANVINPIFTKVAYPLLSKVQNSLEQSRNYYLRLVDIISYVNIIIVTLLILHLEEIFSILWGNKWDYSLTATKYLLIVSLIRSIFNPVGSLLLSHGKPELSFKWNFSLFFLITPSIYFTANNFGINEIAIVLAILYFLMIIPHIKLLINPIIRISYWAYFKTLQNNILISVFIIALSICANYFIVVDNIYILLIIFVVLGMISIFAKIMLSKNFVNQLREVVNA